MSQIEFYPSHSYEEALARAAEECGIVREYWDIFRTKHETSSDVRRRLLEAFGWNVSSLETIEAERTQRFEESAASTLPKTAVISESDKSVPLTFPVGIGGSVGYEISLEEGQRLRGQIDTSQLESIHDVVMGARRWQTYRLPLPVELPLGYHSVRVTLNDRLWGQSNLIVCPDRAYIPEKLAAGVRTAGFNVALYGLRSDRNWGCGDFTDLRNLIDWAHDEIGFSFVGLNPLHALHNRVPFNTSPYLPLSIYYKNLLYIDVERVPEFQTCRWAQGLVKSPCVRDLIQRLREAEFVNYQQVDLLKRRFLKALFREFRRNQATQSERAKAFSNYCQREGDLLHKYALYRALDEVLHKQDRNRWIWQQWPTEYQSPESEACRMFEQQHPRTLDFYKYTQFVIDEQLAAVQQYAKSIGMPIGLYHDLALATDSCGSDLWAHGKFYVSGCRVGAPPDDFSPNGQDWAFPPPNTKTHHDSGYRLYRESIRKILRYGGALRIDHVMRLFRLFWIPADVPAAQGTYVLDNATDLMRILALESVRAKNIIIGEDLGTVTDEIRDMLSRFAILSYRLLYFEKHYPERTFKRSDEYPWQALVSSSTHDLPTIAGFWTYRDIEARKAAGLTDEQGYWTQMEDRKREKQLMLDALHAQNLLPDNYTRNAEDVPSLNGHIHNAIIGFLARVPSMILLLNQEDFTKETEQQNLPGSTVQYPNWQRKMKVKIEDLRAPASRAFSAMFRDQLVRTGRKT
jgi:4-alpha-glucanotransferase